MVLPVAFLSSILVSASLITTFLLELTALTAESRFKVFRSELTKVFMTIVLFYFMTLWLTTWLETLAGFTENTRTWREKEMRKNHIKR